MAFLGSMTNFAKSAASGNEEDIETVMLKTVDPTILVLKAAIEKPKIVMRGLTLLARIGFCFHINPLNQRIH
jgi:hypothetical protein